MLVNNVRGNANVSFSGSQVVYGEKSLINKMDNKLKSMVKGVPVLERDIWSLEGTTDFVKEARYHKDDVVAQAAKNGDEVRFVVSGSDWKKVQKSGERFIDLAQNAKEFIKVTQENFTEVMERVLKNL